MVRSGGRDARSELGARVRRFRARVGISQEELAARCALHRTYVGSVERGERNVSLENILKLAAALSVDPSRLVRGLKGRQP